MRKIIRNTGLVITLFLILMAVNVLWFGAMLLVPPEDAPERSTESTSVFDDPISDTEDDTSPDDTGRDDTNPDDDTGQDATTEESTQTDTGDKKPDPGQNADPSDILYYSQLSETEKQVYAALLPGVSGRQEDIAINPSCTPEELKEAWVALLSDREEIFWAKMYHYMTESGRVVSIQPDYIYTKSEISERQKQIDEVVRSILSKVSAGDKDYDKICYVYEYIVKHTDYNKKAQNNQYIDSVLLAKESVCAGYARTTKLLLNRLGVEAYYVLGYDKKVEDPVEGSHAWTIVKCEGNYYHVDTTWGDPLFDPKDGAQEREGVLYDYLNCNDDEIKRTHKIEEKYTYPSCNRMDWNYYVVNHRYFETFDKGKTTALIHEDIDSGKDRSVFKYASETEYKKAMKGLDDIMQDGMAYYSTKHGLKESHCTYYYEDRTYWIEIFWKK